MKLDQQLQNILSEVAPFLNLISDSEAKQQQPLGKWSKIQILGHLIDSALNNIGRFIRAQKTEDLIFDGYEQEFWVNAQDYENGNWAETIQLFLSLNTQIARLANHIPDEILTKERAHHSISWPIYAPKDDNKPFTLEFLILDYIAHMENHLKQILPDYSPVVWQN